MHPTGANDRPSYGSEGAAPAVVAAAPGTEGSAPVPEPGALFLVGTGLLGVALAARLRRRDRAPQP